MPDTGKPGARSASRPANLPAKDYHFRRQGRSLALILALAAWFSGLVALSLFAEASPWLTALLALPTLPGLYELALNPQSGLDLTPNELRWFSGSRHETVPLKRIARLRLDTRLDLSVRATLILTSGEKLRLPQPAMPPVDALMQACEDHDIVHERHHFSLF